ncbi:MAG TPA: DUF222 domain-containing protein [Marmoricola sp.]|nr:DUF222 domain-containing protein [Marmoricola sp.]
MTTETIDRETGAPADPPAGAGPADGGADDWADDGWLPPRHPLLASIEAIDAALSSASACDPAYLGERERREALLALARLDGRLEAVRLQLTATAGELAHNEGYGSVGAWLAQQTRTDQRPNASDVRLARLLDQRWRQTAAALAVGTVNAAQARVIVDALEDLPEVGVPTEVLADAEARLVAEADHFAPKQLRILGRRILEVVAPEVYEAQEAKALAQEEERARKQTALFTRRIGDGTTKISIRVPDAVAVRLMTYLESFSSPRGPARLGEKVPSYRRLGHAFCAFLETADPKRMPLHGGDATTVLVTISLAELRQQLGAGELGADDRLSASEVRRLACTAAIVPVVLGGQSEPLDLGRASRLFTPAQRKAMAIRDKRCRAEGCEIPAAWCEAHHFRTPWSRGGRTDLTDGKLLCGYHHHRAHDEAFLHDELPNGDVRFHRRR